MTALAFVLSGPVMWALIVIACLALVIAFDWWWFRPRPLSERDRRLGDIDDELCRQEGRLPR